MGGLRVGLFESCVQRGQPAGGAALHGARADAYRGGDLALGQARVVAQYDRPALPFGQAAQCGHGGWLVQNAAGLVRGARVMLATVRLIVRRRDDYE